MEKQYFVYILTNQNYSTFYIGFTGKHLINRLREHQSKSVHGFTHKYNCDVLVYYEQCDDPDVAIEREKQLKRWSRKKKLDLIRKVNPTIEDLSRTVELV